MDKPQADEDQAVQDLVEAQDQVLRDAQDQVDTPVLDVPALAVEAVQDRASVPVLPEGDVQDQSDAPVQVAGDVQDQVDKH